METDPALAVLDMPTAKLSGLLNQFGRNAFDERAADDGDLLARFAAERDESAFAELVRRYGPLVFAVCRRVTGSHHLAEDAFQAVFVVLAAKVASVRATALPGFLHAVACRTALRARTMNDRRRRRETVVERLPEPAGEAPDHADDLAAILDEEIARLPDTLKTAVVLCELEGCSRKAAAERLGVPEGTISSRLAAARKALAKQLRERGIALSATALTAALARQASAAVAADLAARAVSAVTLPAQAPAAVAALSHGVLRLMFAQKLKIAVPLAAIVLGALAFAAFAGGPPAPQEPPVKPVAFAPRADPVPAKPAPKGPNKLLFWRDGKLAMIDPDGKNEKSLAEGGAEGTRYHTGGAMLSPDGTMIAALIPGPMIDDGTPGEKKALASLHVRKLDEKEPGTDLGVPGQMFAWAPDGTEIVCCDFVDGPSNKTPEGTHTIINIKTKVKTAVKLPADHLVTDWTRDGKYFLTSRLGGGKPEDAKAVLYLMNRDGTEHKRLTDEKELSLFGRISPDGTRVLFGRMTFTKKDNKPQEPKQELVLLDTKTGTVAAVQDVPMNAFVMGYCWAPDGKKIAYTWREVHEGKPEDLIERETESHLIVCDPDGKNAKTIVSQKGKGQWHITLAGVDWR